MSKEAASPEAIQNFIRVASVDAVEGATGPGMTEEARDHYGPSLYHNAEAQSAAFRSTYRMATKWACERYDEHSLMAFEAEMTALAMRDIDDGFSGFCDAILQVLSER